jgi:hypothetical protein
MYPVRFTRHVESMSLEVAEMGEEDGDESGDVLCRLLGGTLLNCELAECDMRRLKTYDGLPVFSV